MLLPAAHKVFHPTWGKDTMDKPDVGINFRLETHNVPTVCANVVGYKKVNAYAQRQKVCHC